MTPVCVLAHTTARELIEQDITICSKPPLTREFSGNAV